MRSLDALIGLSSVLPVALGLLALPGCSGAAPEGEPVAMHGQAVQLSAGGDAGSGCVAPTLRASAPTPQALGATVLFTASTTCAGGAPRYEFQVIRPGNVTGTVQAYSGAAAWSWSTSAEVGGDYTVKVRAHPAGDGAAVTESSTAYHLSGTAQVVALPDPDTVEGLAVDDHNVYWTSQEPAPGVYAAPIGGGGISTLASASSTTFGGITAEGGQIYWTEFDIERNQLVLQQPAAVGGTPSTLYSEWSGAFQAPGTRVALGGGSGPGDVQVFFTGVFPSGRALVSVLPGPGGGGEPATWAPDVFDLASPGPASRNVYFTASTSVGRTNDLGTYAAEGCASPLAIDDDNVYWMAGVASDTVLGILSAPRAPGGTPVTLASTDWNPSWACSERGQSTGSMAVVAGSVYFTLNQEGPDNLFSVPAAGGTVSTISSVQFAGGPIVAGDGSLYVATGNGPSWGIQKVTP